MKKLFLLSLAIPLASVAWAAPKASGPVTLTTPGPVRAFAADGNRAALTIRRPGRWQILVWEPAAHRLLTVHTESDSDPNGRVALAGTRVAWDDWYGGLTITTRVSSATLARRSAVSLGSDDGSDYPTGGEVLGPSGDGKLLAFSEHFRCDDSGSEPDCPPGRQTGDIVDATIWRAAPRGGCPTGSMSDFRRPGHCARVATAHGRLTVLDVDAGRIAARTDDGVSLFTGAGRRLLDVPVRNMSGARSPGTGSSSESRGRSRSTTRAQESSSTRSRPRAGTASKTSRAGFSSSRTERRSPCAGCETARRRGSMHPAMPVPDSSAPASSSPAAAE